MARHIWSVLCRSKSVDRTTNALSLFEVVENLSISGQIREAIEQSDSPPAAPVQMALVSVWERDDPEKPEKNARARYVLYGPNGKILARSEGGVVALESHRRARQMLHLETFPILIEGGTFEWRTQVPGKKPGSWRTVARTPFYVSFDDEPSEESYSEIRPRS